jgi:hypothetical protein
MKNLLSKQKNVNTNFRVVETKHDRVPTIYILMVLVFFLGYISIAYVGHYTLVSAIFISKIVVFFSVSFMLIPLKFYKQFFSFNIYEMLLFNLLFTGPGITAMLLWLNFLVHSDVKNEVYIISAKKLEIAGTFHSNKHFIILENNAYNNFPEIRTFENSDYPLLAEAKAIRYKTAKGILGYTILLEHEFLK